ncbi:HAD family hydrolase [Sporolactobacillus laevolacticus]|uniref:Haloacid dehalogenase n=1 Tax=Sporolactobacillus laevolacticus DSM 442 TaxID=1395513 RepID=V6IYQ3_9BACL|nr:HAD-IA family hydrolase [Sporolactobacillus laevolacticus]EST11886.1 haloacid dehalogenase [Sporolactobacillus laevolacticus DSM 442]
MNRTKKAPDSETDVNVVFFDLFFTLITPEYRDMRNENDVLGLTRTEWETYAEDDELYLKRASGKEKNPQQIIRDIVGKMKINATEKEINELLELRKGRMKRALINVNPIILDVLSDLKKSKKKLCLISNADVIDAMYWDKSPLSRFFDYAVFSYEVGYLKPETTIYRIALEKMNARPEECIFIGDGGSDELSGAKEARIRTILTSRLLKRSNKIQNKIKEFADYSIEDFAEVRRILLGNNDDQ